VFKRFPKHNGFFSYNVSPSIDLVHLGKGLFGDLHIWCTWEVHWSQSAELLHINPKVRVGYLKTNLKWVLSEKP
jgi:hypothetical protein